MDRTQIDELLTKFRSGEVSRRGFIRKATALGISAGAASMLAGTTLAQDGTPEAAPIGTPGATPTGPEPGAAPASPAPGVGAAPGEVVSIAPPSREDVLASIREAFEISEPEVEGGQVIYGQTTDIATMNIIIASDVYSNQIAGQVYEFLVATSPIDGAFIPALANTWDVAEDGRTYTFQLTQDAEWSDGTPFTAADVVFSFDATLAEDTLSPRRNAVQTVLESYRAVDDYTFELVAQDRFATFLENTVALVGIMPRHIYEAVPVADWGTFPGSTGEDPSLVVGTGPAIFVEWVPEDHVTLRKNPEYWDEPYRWTIDEFIYRVVPEASALTQSLLTGEVDFSEVSFAEAPSLLENPDITLSIYDTTGVNWYAANQDPGRTELFLDVKVRQALMYALDRNLMAEEIYNGYAIQANGTQPVLSVAYAPDDIEPVFNYNPDLARQLLDEAGWVDEDGDGIREKDGIQFTFECLFSEGVATYEQQLPYMQQAWADIGIAMVPTAVPFTALLDATDTGNYEMAVFGFSWSIDGGQLDMFGCEFVPPQGFNSMRYCNPEYDRLALEARRTLDPEARTDLLVEASNIVNREQAAGYIVFRQDIFGARNTLHNFLPNGYVTLWSLPFVWTEVQ